MIMPQGQLIQMALTSQRASSEKVSLSSLNVDLYYYCYAYFYVFLCICVINNY